MPAVAEPAAVPRGICAIADYVAVAAAQVSACLVACLRRARALRGGNLIVLADSVKPVKVGMGITRVPR